MELQLVFKVWDSLDGWNGRCLNRFGPKRTSQLSYGSQVAGSALFCQWKVISGYGMFEGFRGRVSGSKGCEKDVQNVCTSLFWLMFLVLMYLAYFLYMKQTWEVMSNRPVQASLMLAHLSLGPSNMWILLSTSDMDQCSRNSVLT